MLWIDILCFLLPIGIYSRCFWVLSTLNMCSRLLFCVHSLDGPGEGASCRRSHLSKGKMLNWRRDWRVAGLHVVARRESDRGTPATRQGSTSSPGGNPTRERLRRPSAGFCLRPTSGIERRRRIPSASQGRASCVVWSSRCHFPSVVEKIIRPRME